MMGLLTNIFHLISTALLIPTMLLLLWCLFRALLLVGQVIREAVERGREAKAIERFSAALDAMTPPPALPKSGSILVETLSRALRAGDDLLLVERMVREAELAWDRKLEPLRNLVRLGPMLGLMGTLIPLGPALMGLASGDLQTMASNLIVAFATTVVGLVSAGIALVILSTKRAWYRNDTLLVEYATRRMSQVQARLSLKPEPEENEEDDPASCSGCACSCGNHQEETRHAPMV